MDAPASSFGAYVHKRRKALDLTQEELAQCVGCSASAIRKIESDSRKPSKQIAELLADCLRIPDEEREAFVRAARLERSIESLSQPAAPYVGLSTALGSPLGGPSFGSSSRETHALGMLPGGTPTNLPAPLTPLVGREVELSELTLLLRQPGCQLLTLLGPSGIGKTRLALQAAHDLLDAAASPFEDGVFFVELTPVSSTELVLPAIASALGFQFHGPREEKNQLLEYLRSKKLLLVLDNIEHLLEHPEWLLEILQRARGVKILATSGERMNVIGEWIFEIQGLPVPPAGQIEGLESFSSVQLFLHNARRARPDFRLESHNLTGIVRICRLVEGMPLGIELAAAWVRALSPDEIADEIERNMDFLATSARNIPERHRSLRAAFDYSWKLLRPEEQRAMQQLSIFQGGFRRQAAEQVARAAPPVLLSLVDKSMLRRGEDGRYGMHELIRQYAAAHLARNKQELSEVLDQHAGYFIDDLQSYGEALRGARQKESLAEMTLELDNLRLAWERSVEGARYNSLKAAAQPLLLYYELRNLFREGEMLFQRAVEAIETQIQQQSGALPQDRQDEAEGALGLLMATQAWFSYRSGRTEQALALFRYALALLRKHGRPKDLAGALWYYSSALWFAGDFVEAESSVEEGLALYQATGDLWGVANLTVYQGVIAHERGDFERAYRLLQEGLRLGRATGDPRLVHFAAIFLSRTPQAIQQPSQTEALLAEALQLATGIGDRYGRGVALERLALLAFARGDLSQACSLLHESLTLFTEIGDLWSLSRAQSHTGEIHLSQGDAAAARQAYLVALRTAEEARVKPNALVAMAGLARAETAAGRIETALRLALYILKDPASPKEARAQAENLRENMAHRLSPGQMDELQVRVAASSYDQVIMEIMKEAEILL